MATRQQIVEQVAGQIADQVYGAIQYDATVDVQAEAERLNAAGWTVELSAPLGGVLRCEGVGLTPAELAEAARLGEQYILHPEWGL